jgi:hypothetical protein
MPDTKRSLIITGSYLDEMMTCMTKSYISDILANSVGGTNIIVLISVGSEHILLFMTLPVPISPLQLGFSLRKMRSWWPSLVAFNLLDFKLCID